MPPDEHERELATGWVPVTGWRQFDKGGYLRPGLMRAKNTSGKPERVLGPGEESRDDGAGGRPGSGR